MDGRIWPNQADLRDVDYSNYVLSYNLGNELTNDISVWRESLLHPALKRPTGSMTLHPGKSSESA